MSAVLVASGGVVAALAAPAHSSTEVTTLPATTGDRPAATSAQAAAGVAGAAAQRPGSAFAAPAGQQGAGAGAGTLTRAEKRQVRRLTGTAAALQDVTQRADTAASLVGTARPATEAPAVGGSTAPQTPQAAARTAETSRTTTTAGSGTSTSSATTSTSSATTASTPVIKTSTPAVSSSATAPAGASATAAITRTVEFTGARSQVVSSQALAKRLDRTGLRARSAAAGAALNTSFPVLTRAIARTARNHASTVQLGAGARGSAALSIASGLTGIWYRWGGSSPSGFDCSGYTSYVYRKMGIRLPRTAAAQQAYTKRVRTPRPGDLVFFGAPAHHVGIYAGGGMMYDAPSRGRKTQLRKVYTSRVTYGRIG